MSIKSGFSSFLFLLITMPVSAWTVLPEFSNSEYDILVLQRPAGVILYGIRCKNGGTMCEYNPRTLCKEGVAKSSDPDGNIISAPGYSRDNNNRPIAMFICATPEQLKESEKLTSTKAAEKPKAQPPKNTAQNRKDFVAMFKGKTVSGQHVRKGFSFKDYFRDDGTLIEVRDDGKRKKGKWTLDGSGELCIIWKKKTACGLLTLMPDNSYFFKRKGRTARRYDKFEEGNTL